MKESIKISWGKNREDDSAVTYFINSKKAGNNNEGFDKILQTIRKKSKAEVIIKISQLHGLGGEALEDQLPFKERYNEFIIALGGRKPVYEFLS